MKSLPLKKLVISILDENKAENISALDVRKLTDISDYMIICSATSARHVKALITHLVTALKEEGIMPLGVEGDDSNSDWALVDIGDVIVHIMLPRVREFYSLEKLWSIISEAVGAEAEENEAITSTKKGKRKITAKTAKKKGIVKTKAKTKANTKTKAKTKAKTNTKTKSATKLKLPAKVVKKKMAEKKPAKQKIAKKLSTKPSAAKMAKLKKAKPVKAKK